MTVLIAVPNGASLKDIRETLNAALADVERLKADGLQETQTISGQKTFSGKAIFTDVVQFDEYNNPADVATYTQGGVRYLTTAKNPFGRVNLDFSNAQVFFGTNQGGFQWSNTIIARSFDGRAGFIADDERSSLLTPGTWNYATANPGGYLILENTFHTPTMPDQILGSILGRGKWNIDSGDNPTPGFIMFVSAGPWAQNNCPMDIIFGTAAAGSQTPVERFRITAAGIVVTGGMTAAGNISTAGTLLGVPASPQTLRPFVSGRYYGADWAAGTAVGQVVPDLFSLVPFVPARDLVSNQFGFHAQSGITGAEAKVVVYDSTSEFLPGNLLYESPTVECAATGSKLVDTPFTFLKGKMYWIGLRCNGAPNLIQSAAVAFPLMGGLASPSGTNAITIRRILTYATPAPAIFGAVAQSELVSLNAPRLLMRAA